jgi:hypothetical protein
MVASVLVLVGCAAPIPDATETDVLASGKADGSQQCHVELTGRVDDAEDATRAIHRVLERKGYTVSEAGRATGARIFSVDFSWLHLELPAEDLSWSREECHGLSASVSLQLETTPTTLPDWRVGWLLWQHEAVNEACPDDPTDHLTEVAEQLPTCDDSKALSSEAFEPTVQQRIADLVANIENKGIRLAPHAEYGNRLRRGLETVAGLAGGALGQRWREADPEGQLALRLADPLDHDDAGGDVIDVFILAEEDEMRATIHRELDARTP